MNRKLLTLVITLLCANFLFAQEENQKTFCEIVGTAQLFSQKVNVEIDFGQERSFWKGWTGEMFLVDENGNKLEFNSMIDAMNHMAKFGWEFEQAYVVTKGNQNVYHWLLSKEIKEGDDSTKGINVKGKE